MGTASHTWESPSSSSQHKPSIPSINKVNPQSWVKFTDPSPVPARSSLRHQRSSLKRRRSNPRVEPQEKKKQPKGRAKKRITYTRRFVNVTMTGGKRKMNPNPINSQFNNECGIGRCFGLLIF